MSKKQALKIHASCAMPHGTVDRYRAGRRPRRAKHRNPARTHRPGYRLAGARVQSVPKLPSCPVALALSEQWHPGAVVSYIAFRHLGMEEGTGYDLPENARQVWWYTTVNRGNIVPFSFEIDTPVVWVPLHCAGCNKPITGKVSHLYSRPHHPECIPPAMLSDEWGKN